MVTIAMSGHVSSLPLAASTSAVMAQSCVGRQAHTEITVHRGPWSCAAPSPVVGLSRHPELPSGGCAASPRACPVGMPGLTSVWQPWAPPETVLLAGIPSPGLEPGDAYTRSPGGFLELLCLLQAHPSVRPSCGCSSLKVPRI